MRRDSAQVEDILEAAAKKREAMADLAPGLDREIHGEFGVAIGTGGARAAYGTSIVPFGRDGVAAIPFETNRDSGYRGRNRN